MAYGTSDHSSHSTAKLRILSKRSGPETRQRVLSGSVRPVKWGLLRTAAVKIKNRYAQVSGRLHAQSGRCPASLPSWPCRFDPGHPLHRGDPCRAQGFRVPQPAAAPETKIMCPNGVRTYRPRRPGGPRTPTGSPSAGSSAPRRSLRVGSGDDALPELGRGLRIAGDSD
jgi:hypothetical protein